MLMGEIIETRTAEGARAFAHDEVIAAELDCETVFARNLGWPIHQDGHVRPDGVRRSIGQHRLK
jgi:hypothetical protein